MLRLITLILMTGTIAACSGGAGFSPSQPTESSYPWNSFSVATSSQLPSCSGDIVGRLYYIENTDSFKVCKSSGWYDISIKGENGSNGMTITGMKDCSKSTGGATFRHNIVTYSTGDKFIYCSISNSLNTYSSSKIYLSTQVGASAEGCLITYDIDTGTAGFWSFAVSGSTRTATYTDAGSASNGTVVSFASSDCTTSL